MSSTNRGGQRHPDDYYATPEWATLALLPLLGPLAGKRILEPSAGTGAIVKVLLANGARSRDVTACELDVERAAECKLLCPTWPGDFFATAPPEVREQVDLVIMNPPFSLAQEFVSRCHEHIRPGGTIAALLRLAFVCSKKRAEFRRRFPCGVYPLASRPSFTGDGKSDSADYAWMLFGTDHAGKYRTLEYDHRAELAAELGVTSIELTKQDANAAMYSRASTPAKRQRLLKLD